MMKKKILKAFTLINEKKKKKEKRRRKKKSYLTRKTKTKTTIFEITNLRKRSWNGW